MCLRMSKTKKFAVELHPALIKAVESLNYEFTLNVLLHLCPIGSLLAPQAVVLLREFLPKSRPGPSFGQGFFHFNNSYRKTGIKVFDPEIESSLLAQEEEDGVVDPMVQKLDLP